MYITKKELLTKTGISYGQLYRWKRERLIPEEWFIKQSSYTGQETIFPKQQILTRIEFITSMKDKYSLEEIASMLYQEVNIKEIDFDILCTMKDVDNEVAGLYKMEEYSYAQIALVVIMSEIRKTYDVSLQNIKELIEGISPYFEELTEKEQKYILLKDDVKYYGIMYEEETKVKIDKRLEVIKTFFIDELIGSIRLENKEV